VRCLLPEPLLAQALVVEPGRFLPAWMYSNLPEGGELHGCIERAEQWAW